MDYLSIKNLEVFSRHSAFDGENTLGQKFAVDAKLYLDTSVSGTSDDMSDSVDYAKVCHFINAFIKGHSYRLIETAAERLASDILIEYPVLSKVSLTLKKPWAPVGLPIEEVAVTIDRGWHKAYLSFGSNMGDREDYINKAINYIRENDKIEVQRVSSIHETEPYGMTDQAKFLNLAMEIRTLLSPSKLLTFCKNLEMMAGRVKTEHWGPRPLDIDIIFYDNDIIDTEYLSVPHYDMHNRQFVLEPLAEIAPYLRHPILKKTVGQMLEEVKSE